MEASKAGGWGPPSTADTSPKTLAPAAGATDRAIRLIDRFVACFSDARSVKDVEHTVATLAGQRVFGIALGHEDLIDHDQLRHGPAR